ncbi:uncharacterized protein [Eleutherodactylus coqui]|uniref:uncharacterized protein n=1 Tax=Eleutherodactylus coqui TaxID=57060 RepID=UPI003461DBF4
MRSRRGRWTGSSPDPRCRAVRPRQLHKLQKRKGKKSQFASLGKIIEENADPNQMGNTEAVSVSERESLRNVNEEPLDSHLSPKKQDMTEDAVTSSSEVLRGERTKRKSLKKKTKMSKKSSVDTSEKQIENNSNFEECDEGESEHISHLKTTSDHSASSSSFFSESNDFERESSSLSPEQSCDDHSASSHLSDYESYEDFDFSEVDKEKNCSLSSPEQVREDNSQNESEERAFSQRPRGNKNSTLMEISKAQAINDMSRTFNISPIKGCFSESKRSHLDSHQHFDPTSILVPGLIREVLCPEEINRSAGQGEHSRKASAPVSTLISGKPLCKLRKINHNGRNSPRPGDGTISEAKFQVSNAHRENAESVNRSLGFVSIPLSTSTMLHILKCSSMESESIVCPTKFPVSAQRMNHSLGFVGQPLSASTQVSLPPNTRPHCLCRPKAVKRTMKRVHFCDPLTTEISGTDMLYIPECSSAESESIVPPTMAEVAFILKDLSSKTDGMFLHHPMLRLLEKSGRSYF